MLPQDLTRPQAKEMAKELFTTDTDEFFAEPEVDIVVEAIGGESPALEYLTRALSDGKQVVTANKEVIAKHGAKLAKLAREQGVGLRYEASVGGGIPLISRFQYDLVANEIGGIYAIINGTTNYILTQMAREGVDFSSALARAQELGYAEPDPENDVEGIDATYKLAILASLAFHTEVKPEDIYREGISRLSGRDFSMLGSWVSPSSSWLSLKVIAGRSRSGFIRFSFPRTPFWPRLTGFIMRCWLRATWWIRCFSLGRVPGPYRPVVPWSLILPPPRRKFVSGWRVGAGGDLRRAGRLS